MASQKVRRRKLSDYPVRICSRLMDSPTASYGVTAFFQDLDLL